MEAVVIRAAREHDSQSLFDWRNDERTRAVSGSHEEIDRGSHDLWFAASLANPARHIYLAEVEGEPVGMCRFDDGAGAAEVSINLAPGHRGRGLSGAVLSGAIAAYRAVSGSTLVARIRPANVASVRLFEGAGFVRAGSDGEFDRYEL